MGRDHKRELPPANLSLNQSEGFYRAFTLLKASFHPNFTLPPDMPVGAGPDTPVPEGLAAAIKGIGSLVAPMIVTLSFACELMLKALLAKTGANSRGGHKLLDLFEDLPLVQREQMKAAMVGVSAARFDGQIVACANAFEDWRYAHEKDFLTVEVDFLEALYEAARAVVVSA